MFGDAEETCGWMRHFHLWRVLEGGAVGFLRKQLVAFALSDRVVAEGCHAVAREKF